MYSYIKGELTEVYEDGITIEVNGIGYAIKMPMKMMEQLPGIGAEIKVHTYLHVREDIFCLYGFLSKDALELFKMLIGVSGIGPKGGLAILSVLSTDDLRFAILGDDAKAISKAPGVGLKTAQRLIIELKDKFSLEDAFEQKIENVSQTVAGGNGSAVKNEAIQALVALGYSSSDAIKVLQSVEITPESDVEDVLKAALKQMALI